MSFIEASAAGYYDILLTLSLITGISALIAIFARFLRKRLIARIAFAIFVVSLLSFAAIFFYVVLYVWRPVVNPS